MTHWLILVGAWAAMFFGGNTHAHAKEAACENPRTLRLALIPKSSPEQQRAQYQPLMQALARTLSRRVELVPAASYGSVVEALLTGAVDVAELGPATYAMVMGRQPDAVRPFASLAARGQPATVARYQSVLMVRRDANVAGLAELRGRTLALVDPASTSGALLPRHAVQTRLGLSLDAHFGRVIYAGSHDRAIAAVHNGQVDAAFVSSARLDEAERQGWLAASDWVALWRSDPIPFDPFVLRQGLCAPVREAIAQAFLTNTRNLRPLLDALGSPAFVAVTDADYRALRENLTAVR